MSPARPARWSINGRFLTQPITGVQRYAREITKAMDAALAADATLRARLRLDIVVPADCGDVPAYQALAVRRSRLGHGHAWEQSVLPAMTAGGGLINLANLAPLAHGRAITCVHDANTFLEPDSYSRPFRVAYQALTPLLARRARAVITVSAFSQAMLGEVGVTREPARIIANGHEHALGWDAARSRLSAPDAFPRPFVFALGSRARHKQVDRLVATAPGLDAMGVDLVLSGGSAAIFAEADAGDAPPNVRTLGFVGDDDLAALFRRALCFAFPSRTEGFGLPLLEAMVHNCPIVTAARASMPEVCGQAALYADPDDPAAWLQAIAALRDAPERGEALRAQGRARYPRFSWAAGAAAYLDLALSPQVAGAGRLVAAP